MAEQPLQQPVPLAREREQAVQILCGHFAADNLTVEEFETRLDSAYTATTTGELEALLTGLPALPAEAEVTESLPTVGRVPAESVRQRGFQIAVMGGSDRRGTWTPPRQLYTVALMGGAGLDFREAKLPPGITNITVIAFMGGVEIIVPPGLGVQTRGVCCLGGFDALDQASAEGDPEAPMLRINGFACMGGVEVKVRLPGESEREARRRLRRRRRHRLSRGEEES